MGKQWKHRPLGSFQKDRICSSWNTKYSGKIAGSICHYGYIHIRVDGKDLKSHRLAWMYMYGTFPDADIDHINGIKTDNRIINLRDVSRSENHKNKPIQRNNTTGCVGVSWNKDLNKWRVRIQTDGKSIHIGMYSDYNDAVASRKNAERISGFHKNHGRSIP